jgi:sacsin
MQEPCDLAALTELLYSFKSTATEALLFLRSVRSISVYLRDKASELPSESLELLYKVERAASLKEDPQQAILNFIRGGGRDVVASKEAFLLRLQRAPESALPGGCARVDILITGPPQKKSIPDAHVHSAADGPPFDAAEERTAIRVMTSAEADDDVSSGATSQSGGALERAGQSWLVCNKLGGGRARAHALAPEARGRGFVPWAGVAARLDAEIQGRAFCFLPLPVTNQLPVHANGYFELSSNRWAAG